VADTRRSSNLHGHADTAAFFAHACELAQANHGWAGYHFATKFAEALRSSRTELRQDFEAARQEYLHAAAGITSSWRDLVRVHGRFATIFAPGCLAIRFEALPLTKQELLAAILVCERDHVAFIDQEVRELRLLVTPTTGAPIAVAEGTALAGGGVSVAGVVVPVLTPFDRLRRFINANRRRGFIDLRKPGLTRIRFKLLKLRVKRSKGARVLVYVGEHNGQTEYLFPGDVFQEVAGGSGEASALKKELFRRGLLETYGRSPGVSYVVKRPLPDGTRPFFVVVRHRPQKSPGQGQALPTAAPA